MPRRSAATDADHDTKKPRAPSRRIGNENSATRALLLDTTEQLMIDEGYAAVTTRRVAAEVGVKAPLVHYYFPTTDDLFLAVYRRAAERFYQRLDETLSDPRPLHALWSLACDNSRTTLAIEFMALANHRKVVGKELTLYIERARQHQADALQKIFQEQLQAQQQQSGIDLDCPPLALTVLMAGVGRALVMEGGIGIALGHAEARAVIEELLDRIEPPATATAPDFPSKTKAKAPAKTRAKPAPKPSRSSGR